MRERTVKMAETTDADDAPPEDQANLSDLVKEIVKEMDGDEFYSKPDLYDESAEVRRWVSKCALQRLCCLRKLI